MSSEPGLHTGKSGTKLALLALLLLLVSCGVSEPKATLVPTETPLPEPSPVPTPLPNVLYVDAALSLGTISPYVYGTNHGPWASVPFELQPQAEAAGITFLRFPGGNWGDQNDLRPLQIDRFITLARSMQAEPSISARLQGGSPEQAAELVRYVNVENDYGVRYWSIGNEPALYGDYDTVRHNAEWRAIAEAMLAVDPDILFIGPEVTQYTGNPTTDPRDEAGRDWMREFLLANGDLVDIVSIHRYPFPSSMTSPPASIDDLRGNSREWDQIIPNLRALIHETTGRDVPIAVTEANSHWNKAYDGEATPDSFYNAIWWADVLGRLIRQGVTIVAHFSLQSNASTGGWGLLGRSEVRPSYYVYQMYKHFGQELLYASSDDPDLSIYAARREDGALTLMVINLGPEEKEKPLLLSGFTPGEAAEVWRFDAGHMAEPVGTETLGAETAIALPAQSITLYVVP